MEIFKDRLTDFFEMAEKQVSPVFSKSLCRYSLGVSDEYGGGPVLTVMPAGKNRKKDLLLLDLSMPYLAYRISFEANINEDTRESVEFQGWAARMEASIAEAADSACSGWLLDYSQAKNRLFIRVNDIKADRDWLKKAHIPFRDMDGLAVTCHIAVTGLGPMLVSAPVTYAMLDAYGVNTGRLFEDAANNAKAINPPTLTSTVGFGPVLSSPDMMSLTTENAVYGAGALFYPGMMDDIAEVVGGPYIALPVTLHEMFILPDTGTWEYLEAGYRQTNQAFVMPEMWLSDTVYYYDPEEHVFESFRTHAARTAKQGE